MNPLVIVGALLVLSGIIYFKNRSINKDGVIPPSNVNPESVSILDEIFSMFKTDEIYYYPSDSPPKILGNKNEVTWFDPVYGCPPGYKADQIWEGGGGPEYPGVPGSVNPLIYCRAEPLARPDLLRYPLEVYQIPGYGDSGNSSAFRDWTVRNTVLTNYMVGMKNTVPYGIIGPDGTYEIDINTLTRGGTGALPTPYQYPSYI